MKIEHSFKGEEQYCTQCNAPRGMHRTYGSRRHKPKDTLSITFLDIDGEGTTDHFGSNVCMYKNYHYMINKRQSLIVEQHQERDTERYLYES